MRPAPGAGDELL